MAMSRKAAILCLPFNFHVDFSFFLLRVVKKQDFILHISFVSVQHTVGLDLGSGFGKFKHCEKINGYFKHSTS